MFKYVEMQI